MHVKISGGAKIGGWMRLNELAAMCLVAGLIAVCGCGLSYDAKKGAESVEPPPVHPEIWPAIANPVPTDPGIEDIEDAKQRLVVLESR